MKKPTRSPKPERDEQAADTAAEDRLFGRNPIQEALRAGREINKAWVLSGRVERDLYALILQLREAGVPVLEVSRQVLDSMAGTGSHQGIVAQIAAHEYADIEDILTRTPPNGQAPLILILDSINDGYNLGALLRLADTAGISGIVLPKRRSVSLDAFVAKASAGAVEHVPVARVTNLSQTIARLKADGYWVVGTDAAADTAYTEIDWSGKIALIAGSEGGGISPKLLQHCDFLVNIPQYGQVNSLNVAVATGIILFEALRRRGDPA
ncbi:MAG TPA: 23S rRNA (guanosine(2251)-2'-O)-methyltransferase RlmB [Clostridiaceae bacterium]|jgi:23S rRNA (guanosine2251-2'-O)-methyltransferase|nr:23S rRNA (guanosine(2251)-2'-O)-methyltransferase RlmB [Clostridiaceae bacterium]